MALWGASDADESKPKNMTTAEKKQVFATTAGWVRESGNENSGNDNTSADPEVLVAIGALTTSLGAATITSCEFVTTAWDASAGGTLQARVRWNEAVDVSEAGSGFKLNIQRTPDGGSAASHTLRYASGTGTNELVFSLAIAGGSPVAADDVYAFNAQSLVKAGATTCKDAGTSTDSEVVITSAQATAAGTITATA
jgi:hypothetical protein